MPMPKLDEARYVWARLADPSHKLPLPGSGLFFPATEAIQVDSHDSYWRLPLADGSLRRVAAPAPAPVEAAPGAPEKVAPTDE